MNKLLLFTILWVSAFITVSAQTPTIGYTYDANGNRTSRYIVVVKSRASALKSEVEQPAAQIDDGSQTIAIYPNPTKGIFSIGVTGLNSEQENYFILYNLQGKLLKRQRITSGRTTVDITWDAAGMYLLDVSLEDSETVNKVVRW